jgi:hypothetical protein
VEERHQLRGKERHKGGAVDHCGTAKVSAFLSELGLESIKKWALKPDKASTATNCLDPDNGAQP